MKNIFFLLLILLVLSCDSRNDALGVNDFGGYYEITWISSTKAVDLNNDGLESTNILAELENSKLIANEEVHSFYNPALHYAEIRPLYYHTNNAQLISFGYPYQVIGYIDEEKTKPYLISYKKEFLNFSYEFITNDNIQVIDNAPDYHSPMGKIHSLTRLDASSFILEMAICLFDFKEKDWVETNVTVTYSKVKDEF